MVRANHLTIKYEVWISLGVKEGGEGIWTWCRIKMKKLCTCCESWLLGTSLYIKVSFLLKPIKGGKLIFGDQRFQKDAHALHLDGISWNFESIGRIGSLRQEKVTWSSSIDLFCWNSGITSHCLFLSLYLSTS